MTLSRPAISETPDSARCSIFGAAPVVFRWKYKMDEIIIV
jgi:hypothetical protein